MYRGLRSSFAKNNFITEEPPLPWTQFTRTPRWREQKPISLGFDPIFAVIFYQFIRTQ